MYSSLFRELLTYMMEDPRSISQCTHLLFMAKNIERIGDHATNIAENLYYLVNGTPLEQARPKNDVSSLEVVAPGGPARPCPLARCLPASRASEQRQEAG